MDGLIESHLWEILGGIACIVVVIEIALRRARRSELPNWASKVIAETEED